MTLKFIRGMTGLRQKVVHWLHKVGEIEEGALLYIYMKKHIFSLYIPIIIYIRYSYSNIVIDFPIPHLYVTKFTAHTSFL